MNRPSNPSIKIKASDIELKYYSRIAKNGPNAGHISISTNMWLSYLKFIETNAYISNLNFFKDLRMIGEKIVNQSDKLTHLKKYLNEMNKKLPACVYIPLIGGLTSNYVYFISFKGNLRECAILHIAVDESKVFKTKDRAPFYICVESYRPQEYIIRMKTLYILLVKRIGSRI